MDLKFRKLQANEIEARVSRVNEYGVSLLLYKDARCDQRILDETVGPMNWQRHHSRDNRNCIVSIFNPDLNQWIEKEDTGCEPGTDNVNGALEKGLASDSFKRSCFCWGIGRELYTAPNIFIFSEKLQGHKQSQPDGKWKCGDSFKVTGITYDGDSIATVTIDVSYRGKVHDRLIFSNAVTGGDAVQQPQTPVQIPAQVSVKTTSAAPAKVTASAATAAVQTPKQPADTHPKATSDDIADDEVILVGNCRGKKYGEVKNSPVFLSFLKWTLEHSQRYHDAESNIQFEKFKRMAAQKQGGVANG
jgi:hypothetical protein